MPGFDPGEERSTRSGVAIDEIPPFGAVFSYKFRPPGRETRISGNLSKPVKERGVYAKVYP